MKKKQCKLCGIEKETEQFYTDKKNPTGFRSYCKICDNENRTIRNRSNNYKNTLWSRYRLTLTDYNEMWESQDGCCFICKRRVPLVVDHDHLTDKVRGLLCRRCNIGIGQFEDNIELLEKVINYLRINS